MLMQFHAVTRAFVSMSGDKWMLRDAARERPCFLLLFANSIFRPFPTASVGDQRDGNALHTEIYSVEHRTSSTI